jgi:hypothetical protein
LISNCGAVHLDWSGLSLSGYYEAMEAHNVAHDPKAPKQEPASPEFREQMRKVFAAQKRGSQ